MGSEGKSCVQDRLNTVARILVVDDDPTLLRLSGMVLTDLGYEVTVSSTGNEAIEAAERAEGAFDLVVLDVRMPDMDGLTVLARLRERWPGIKVLVVTGFATEIAVRTLLENGAAGVLAKPYDGQELAVSVRSVLGNPGQP